MDTMIFESILGAVSSTKKGTVIEYLNDSTFDELISIDMNADTFKFVYSVEDKYFIPITDGLFSVFFSYTLDHRVHPDDKALYSRILDPATLLERLESSPVPGILRLQFRIRSMNDGWQWIEEYIIGGEQHGLPKGIVYCYVFDIQNKKNREFGKSTVRHGKAVVRDKLTGLIREKDFFAAAEGLLEARRTNWMLVSIDLEQFKLFNEWYGWDTGDMVLARIGAGLERDAEKSDGLAGYLGNDDFCLLVPVGKIDVDELFRKVHGVLTRYGVSVGFLPAFGVAASNGGVSIMSLFDQASLASKAAKKDFKNRIRCFDPSMYITTAEDFRILSEFQDALKNGEITFFLQPQCRVSNGRIVGAESLARWLKPNGIRVPPSVFVPVLEKYGFISDLDKFIWESVCRWVKSLGEKGLPTVPVSCNVSQVDIFTIDVPDYFTELTDKYCLPRSAVKIEITESACGEDSEKVRKTVQELRSRGFMVLMDDFGSGYSSLNMLHELNIDIIKLDAHFLRLDSTTERKGIHIIESVVNMAKTIGLPIIVEGVETEEQKDYLASLGCRYIQGYYFYEPMEPEAFEELISHREKVDESGFVFKANDEFRIREFLNDTVYSDSMLNNIIGPAAIYSLDGEKVNIIRFNEQFYEAVNVPDFHQRLVSIEQFMPESDRRLIVNLMHRAEEDRLNGASGVMSFGRIDGGYSRFLIHFYYLDSTGEQKRFYGAARNVTEITNLQKHMELISKYASDTIIFLKLRNGEYSFEVVAHGLADYVKIPRDQLEKELSTGAIYARVIGDDRKRLFRLCMDAIQSMHSFSTPFTMRTGSGEGVHLSLNSDYVDEETSDVRYIISIRKE